MYISWRTVTRGMPALLSGEQVLVGLRLALMRAELPPHHRLKDLPPRTGQGYGHVRNPGLREALFNWRADGARRDQAALLHSRPAAHAGGVYGHPRHQAGTGADGRRAGAMSNMRPEDVARLEDFHATLVAAERAGH